MAKRSERQRWRRGFDECRCVFLAVYATFHSDSSVCVAIRSRDLCLASPCPRPLNLAVTRATVDGAPCVSSFHGHLATTSSMQHVPAPRATLNLTPNWPIAVAPNWQARWWPARCLLAVAIYMQLFSIWFILRAKTFSFLVTSVNEYD